MPPYKRVILSFFICAFLVSNQMTNLAVLHSGGSRAVSAMNMERLNQNIPCGIWAWDFPKDPQDPRLILEQNDLRDTGADCRTEISLINNTGIPINIGNILSTDVLSYSLELSIQGENSSIEWKYPYDGPTNHYFAVQDLNATFGAIPLNPQQYAKVLIEGRQTTASLANDIALFLTFRLIDWYPCIPVHEAIFSAINLSNQGFFDKAAQLLWDRKLFEASRELPDKVIEFYNAFLLEGRAKCAEDVAEKIIERVIGNLSSMLLQIIYYSTHVIADYSFRYHGSPAKLTIGYQPSVPPTSATASIIPDGYWSGPVNRPAPEHYTMNLTLLGCTTAGAVCGSVEFPELSCKGTITYLGFVSGYFRLLPTLDQGWAHCVNYPELKAISDPELQLQQLQGDSWNGVLAPPFPQEGMIAMAMLTRYDSPPSSVIPPPPLDGDCPSAPTRIKVGDTATVIQSAFLYSRPDLSQQSIIDNSYVEYSETILIIDGPVCGAQQRWYSAKHNGQVGLIPEVGSAGVYRYVAGVPGFFGCVGLSLRQLFGMRLDGQDYLVLQGTRHLIPNDDTKKALGDSASGNPWNLSDDAMRQYKKGQAVPDVDTDPIGFANFRDQLYPCFSEAVLPP